MDKIKWTDEEIIKRIFVVMVALGIDRMPSRKEIYDYYGNHALNNKISKTGGFYHWAKELGLEVKKSETLLGIRYEEKAKEILETKGLNCEITSVKCPYDLLVNGCVKIEVKVANISKAKGFEMYSFGIHKKRHTCDVFIGFCLDDKQNIKKTYIIPGHTLCGLSQLSVGVFCSKYDKYLDNWDCIKTISDAFKGLTA